MKYSAAEFINLLDENSVEAMIWDERISPVITTDDIKKRVYAEMGWTKEGTSLGSFKRTKPDGTHTEKGFGRFWRKRLAVLMIVLLIAAVPGYALMRGKLNISSVVTDENRYLVGTQTEDEYYIIIDDDGTCTDSFGNKGTVEEIISLNELPYTSDIVKEIDDPVIKPSSFAEIRSERHFGRSYAYPPIILVNNSPCILTDDNGEGWYLDEGDTINVEITEDKIVGLRKQNMIIGCIQDGVLKSGVQLKEISDGYKLTAKDSGTYYIYLLSASSDYLTLEGISVNVVR